MPESGDGWPSFDYPASSPAIESLHMQTQVVGKVKLALTPASPEWQTVPLWVTARGLTTGLMEGGGPGVEVAFDLIDHRVDVTTSDGERQTVDLSRPMPLRDFTAKVLGALSALGIDVQINPMTVEVPNPVRCDEYEGCDRYDAEVAERLHAIFVRVAAALEAFRSGFWGKQSQVGLYWGTFDLSVARYNLVPVTPRDGVDLIHRVAMDTEQFEVGFWPGNDRYPRPAFFAFTYPSPAGIADAAIDPKGARWDQNMGEFLLDYDDVIASDDPAAAILEFASGAYAVGADLAGWDRTLLDWSPPA
jgi:hypothetical protein